MWFRAYGSHHELSEEEERREKREVVRENEGCKVMTERTELGGERKQELTF